MKKTWHAGFFKTMMKSIETLLKKKNTGKQIYTF